MNKLILLVLVAFAGCRSIDKTNEVISNHYPVKVKVLEGLKHPWSMAFISEEEALITEKDGNLLKVNLITKEKKIVKGFPGDLIDSIRVIHRGDNSGIFEVVLDPDFKNNHYIYVSYAAKATNRGSTTKVIRAVFKSDSLSEIKTILEATPYVREFHHYGGGITFGRDGKLYITIGERLFKEIDEPAIPLAQDVKDQRGKIYRINADGSIPKDNPDFGEGAVQGLYAVGIRAAQGLTVEPVSGKIWFSEHGTKQGDEINILEAKANYGWPLVTTGEYRSKEYIPPTVEGVLLTNPIWFWKHTVAPTGLTFYTGTEFPQWKNNLFVPGLSSGSLWRFRIENQTIKSAEQLFVDDAVRARKVIQSPAGKLYMLTDEPDGKLMRITKP